MRLNKAWKSLELKPILVASLLGGIFGGILLLAFYQLFLPYLPQEFLENAQIFNPPAYTRLLYGGITEEILIRWGLMSFMVWVSYRITQKGKSKVGSYNYIVGIVVAAFVFGVGHLPAANVLASVVTAPLVASIIIGNSLSGLIAGYLYWRRGLESAILAHMLVHIIMIFGGNIIG